MSSVSMADQQRYKKRFRLLCLYLFLTLPWIGWGAVQSLETQANSPLEWVAEDFVPRQSYDAFQSRFGAGDALVIGWDECKLGNPSLDSFTRVLRKASCFFDEGGAWYFQRVDSGRELVARLMQPPLCLDEAEASRRVRGWMIGPDAETTCVVITFNAAGLAERSTIVPLVKAAAHRYGAADEGSLHLAGPVVDGYTVDQASQQAMRRFAPLSAILTLCMCLICLDSLAAALLVFGVASLCQLIALAVPYYCGDKMTALLIVMPPLVQVLAVAGGVHLVNYHSEAAERGNDEAAIGAFQMGWLPCSLSSLTTAIGLGSLLLSGLVAVRAFAAYAAISVLLTSLLLLSLVPGALLLLGLKPPGSHQRRTRSGWQTLAEFLSRHARSITVIALLGMMILGIGVTRLRASVRIETLFGSESRLMQDYAWLEEHVGALVPIEIALAFTRDCPLAPSQKLDLLRRVEERLREQPQVTSVTSGLILLPDRSHVDLAKRLDAGGLDRLIAERKPMLQACNYLAIDGDRDTWRLTANVSAVRPLDYADLLVDIRDRLDRTLGQHTAAPVAFQVSGLMPLVHEIQTQLLRDLFASFLGAFLLIAMVMSLVQAGIFPGLLAMIPNVFPALALFGLLGWCQDPIDIGTIMTASVAMGIAVDDTLHFLTFVRRQLNAGNSRLAAIIASYQQCGRAMIQTSLICGVGLSVFMLSNFVPTAQFAWMMLALLSAALIGDLIILPAMILSPLGRVLFPQEYRKGHGLMRRIKMRDDVLVSPASRSSRGRLHERGPGR